MSPDLAGDPRTSGQVRRYHTWQVLREQSIGEHQWQTARILLAIYPSCDKNTLVEALFHDIGEGRSGDPPYPVKRDNSDLKVTMDRIEHESRLSMALGWGVPPPRALSDLQRWSVKLAEVIETWEFGVQEMIMGNSLAKLIVVRNSKWLEETIQGELVSPTRPDRVEVAELAVAYIQRRGKEWLIMSLLSTPPTTEETETPTSRSESSEPGGSVTS